MRRAWTIISGEYPPAFGGVADYTFLVAEALAAAGDDVDVFAPRRSSHELPGRARVHRLAHRYSPRGLVELRHRMRALEGPRTVLVQYVAQSFGMRAVNVPFARSLRSLAGESPLWIMFHEYAMEDDAKQSAPRRIQAWLTRANAAAMARAADRMFVSTSLWEPRLRIGAPNARIDILPIPSNLPTSVDVAEVARIRATFAGSHRHMIGHFGTYRMPDSRQFLREMIPIVCERSAAITILLLGRNSDTFAAQLQREYPAYASAIRSTGAVDPAALAHHIASCDIMIQPYGEGVTMRRGSLLGGLALGVPTITTLGPQSEPLWHGSDAVALIENDPRDVAKCIDSLFIDAARRERLSRAARALYESTFALGHTIDRLREDG